MLIPTLYSRFGTFRSHQNQELSVSKRYANIDSVTFSKTFMLTVRPRPSSSNQVEKRQSQWDHDKTAETIFPTLSSHPLLRERFSLRSQQNLCSKTIQKDCQCVEFTGKIDSEQVLLAYTRPMCYLLHKLPFSPSPLSFLPLLPHAPREVSTEISVVRQGALPRFIMNR